MAVPIPILDIPQGTSLDEARIFLNAVWNSTPTGYSASIKQAVAGSLTDADFQDWLKDPTHATDIQSWFDGIVHQAKKNNVPGSDEMAREMWKLTVDHIGYDPGGDTFDFSQVEANYGAQPTVTAAARSTNTVFPAVLEQLLRSRGHIEGIRQWDPGTIDPATGVKSVPSFIQVPVLDEEAATLLHEAGKEWFAGQLAPQVPSSGGGMGPGPPPSQGFNDTSAWDWQKTSDMIDTVNEDEALMIWELAFPQQAQDYVVIYTTNPDGTPGKAVPVPKNAVIRMETYLDWVSQGQVNTAILAGVKADVPWQNILMVADYLHQLDPTAEFDEFWSVDETTGSMTYLAEPGAALQVAPKSKVFTDIATRIKEGMRLYDNDEALAILHAADDVVARRVRFNPENLSPAEVAIAQNALKPYMGFTSLPDSPAASWSLQYIMSLEPSAVEPPEEREVSEAEVRESYRELYKTWFMADPTDEELDKFSDHFNDALDSYQRRVIDARPNPFDLGDFVPVGTGVFGPGGTEKTTPALKTGGFIEGQPALGPEARGYLRAADVYGGLYGQKPAGMTEEGYLGTMESAAQDVLGRSQGAMAEASIQAGMRTGDPQSVGRHAVYSGAGETSSTLKGRMARAGDIFRRMT